MLAGAIGRQKKGIILKLELYVVVICLTWMLGTILRSSEMSSRQF